MNDLINEKEFLQPKAYNPWKRFMVFYVLASVFILLNYLTGSFFTDDSPVRTLTTLIDFISPLIVFLMMFFYKWKYQTSVFTNILASLFLSLTYVVTIIILNLINPAERIISDELYIEMTLFVIQFYGVYFIFFTAIILPVTINRNRKSY